MGMLRGSIAIAALCSGCSLYFDDGREPPIVDDDPPVEEELPPVAEMIARSVEDPFDIAVDEQYVYWTESSPDAASGAIVRWNKTTQERVVLARVTDGVPSEIDLSAGYAYWTEIRGWTHNGRTLGQDRLMRVPVDGTGVEELVAADQWFETYEATNVAPVGDRVYWLSSGSPFDSDGAVRYTQSLLGVLPVVETLRSGLDTPRVIGANAANVCFRIGHPNYDSPIWCAATTGGTLRTVDSGFPRSLVWVDDVLYWVDEYMNKLVRVTDSGREAVLSVGAAHVVVGLEASGDNMFWDEVYEIPDRDIVRMSRPDGSIATVTQIDEGWISSFAVDEQHVYLVDRATGRILRAPRP